MFISEKTPCLNGMLYISLTPAQSFIRAAHSCANYGYNFTNFDGRTAQQINQLFKGCNISTNESYWIKSLFVSYVVL